MAPQRRAGLGNSTYFKRGRSLSASGDMTELVSRRHGRRLRVGSIHAHSQSAVEQGVAADLVAAEASA